VVYFADKKNFPYGEKSYGELLAIVRTAVRTLIESGANIIVLACNSVTVATIGKLRDEFTIPIIGIEPAVKQAAAETKNGKIGVLATQRTVEDHEGEALAPNCVLYKSHNATLVSKLENDSENITDTEINTAMEPFISENVDSVVLGCTHYHFIKKRLERLYPAIKFYAPEEAVVNHMETVINENGLELTDGNDIFLCSADNAGFRKSLHNLLGIENADIREI
jgi:glutamate racemase